MHSKLAKRVLGTLVSAAVMVSMIPSLALADGENGLVDVTFTISGTVRSGGSAISNGVVMSPVGGQASGNQRYFGVDEYAEGTDPDVEDDIVGSGTFTFSLDPAGAYAGGEITKIVIDISGGPNNMAFVAGTDDGWSDFQSGAFTWTPKSLDASFDEVYFTLDAVSGNGHYFNYSSISVTVRVPVNSITVEPDEDEEKDFMYVDDDSFFVVATVDPNTTTYDDAYMVWTSSDDEVFAVEDYEDNLAELAPIAPGTATVTAALGGMTGEYEINVYDHVNGASISETEVDDLLVGYTFGLEAYPTNQDDVRDADWDVTFVSSDEDIATVTTTEVQELGQVYAVAEGEVDITAIITDYSQPLLTAGEGSEQAYQTYEVTCHFVISKADSVAMYRLYNPNSGEHFYTADIAERDNLESLGWSYEGIGWIAPSISDTPVYRLYNPNAGEHHYTTDPAERDMLVEAGWNYEDIGWYSDDARTVPVYRQYNPNEFANNHNYTVDVNERDYLISLGWMDEDIGWFASARALEEAT